MAGRTMRPHESIAHGLNDRANAAERREMIAASAKPSCLIVDFVGNSGRHKLMTSADILGGKVSDEAIQAATLRARQAGKPVRMDSLLEEEEARLREARRMAEEATRARLVAKANFEVKIVDPFDLLQLQPVAPRGWDKNKVLSEKQVGFLRKQGINPYNLPYAQAKQLIGEIIGRFSRHLCTLNQAKLLKKFGVSTDLTFEAASKTIDAIARNGWRKPAGMGVPLLLPPKKKEVVFDEEDNVPF
jgi:hypothetical protein